jgi:hypothetical protein
MILCILESMQSHLEIYVDMACKHIIFSIGISLVIGLTKCIVLVVSHIFMAMMFTSSWYFYAL